MINDSIVRRLASACAHGSRQQALVNELLAGGALKGKTKIGSNVYVHYGLLQVGYTSFRNLRRRLHAAGFIVVTDHQTGIIMMTFPELEIK